MKRGKLLIALGAILFLPLAACAVMSPPAKTASTSTHPVPMGVQDCIDCHRAATPVQVQQWEQSAHGFAMVQCQVCHGDADNFAGQPGVENCRSCHAKQVTYNAAAPGTSCAACHLTHSFTVHKGHQYK